MGLFDRIFGITKEEKENSSKERIKMIQRSSLVCERRLCGRFKLINDSYPLKIKLRLALEGSFEQELIADTEIINLSESGTGLKLKNKEVLHLINTKKLDVEKSLILFELEDLKLAVNFKLIHKAANKELGVKLIFKNLTEIEKYFEILSPVVVGQTLKETPPHLVKQDQASHKLRVFTSDRNAILSIWVEENNLNFMQAFEFIFEGLCVQKLVGVDCPVECFTLESEPGNGTENVIESKSRNKNASTLLQKKMSVEESKQSKKYLKWIIMNTSSNISGELKSQLLESLR